MSLQAKLLVSLYSVNEDPTCCNFGHSLDIIKCLFFSICIQGMVLIVQPLLDRGRNYSSVALGDGGLTSQIAYNVIASSTNTEPTLLQHNFVS